VNGHGPAEPGQGESDMRRALVSGMDPVEAYLKFGKS
jgi:hypothetical protein